MRTLVLMLSVLLVVATMAATAALAQHDDTPMVFVPEFAVQPSPSETVRHFPPRALGQNTSGIVVLCCTPGAEGALQCSTRLESPAGRGFAEASVRASRAYRLTEQSHADLVARPGVMVRLSMRWAAPLITPETIEELRRIDRETAYICLPPIDVEVTPT